MASDSPAMGGLRLKRLCAGLGCGMGRASMLGGLDSELIWRFIAVFSSGSRAFSGIRRLGVDINRCPEPVRGRLTSKGCVAKEMEQSRSDKTCIERAGKGYVGRALDDGSAVTE